MSRIEVRLHYRMGDVAGMLIEPALAGTKWIIHQAPLDVEVAFPAHGADSISGQLIYTGTQGSGSELEGYELNVLKVRAVFDDPFSADDVAPAEASPPDESASERYNALHRRLEECEPTVRLALQRFLAYLKMANPELGLADAPPQQLGPGMVTDLDRNTQLPFVVRPRWETTGVAIAGRQPVRTASIAAHVAALNAGEEPPIARSLLADAFFAAVWTEHSTGWVDVKRAVLLAAVALEVQVKSMLREHVRSDMSDLLEVLIPEQRQSPLSMMELFTSVAQSAIGRSLRREDPDLLGSVRRLFHLRNALAHRGEVPDPTEVRGLIQEARRAFEWLDTWQAITGVSRDALTVAGDEQRGTICNRREGSP